jgi:uncharacterized protein YjbI with pentapeptide repeats
MVAPKRKGTIMITSSKRRSMNLIDWLVMGILIVLFVGAVAMSLFSHFRSHAIDVWAWADSILQNFGTEMLGAFLAFLLIEVLRGYRREREAEARLAEEKKIQLIARIRSGSQEDARETIAELRKRGWLQSGVLKGEDLRDANLVKARLTKADLSRANLRGVSLNMARLLEANLQGANMIWCDLSSASLDNANLQEAILRRARLAHTSLKGTNLQNAAMQSAQLSGAKLHGTDLRGADLRGAGFVNPNIGEAEFDQDTILPDGTHWSLDAGIEQIIRFIKPDHPDFWRSDDPDSPAYRGDAD